MRCLSFCTANKYQLLPLADFFKADGYIVTFYRDVLHLAKPGQLFDLFFFANGCFIAWGLNQRREAEILKQIKPFAIDPLERIETDRFVYLHGERTKIVTHRRLKTGVIRIEDSEARNVLIKLAISYGLAQSVKLEAFEESIQKTINNNQHIPHQLMQKGYISLSRKAISKHIGEIFTERSSVNLSSEYFDIPEYFWEFPDLEKYYLMTERYLDFSKRVTALNHKLDVLHELFDVLNNQLQHRYSSTLELIIILLIFIEIVISLLPHFSSLLR